MLKRSLAIGLLVASTGCPAPDGSLATRAKGHLQPMKPVYERGVVTWPGATDEDRRVYRQQMLDLERLLDAGGAK